MSDIVLREDHRSVTWLTLNDPTTLNSLSNAMIAKLSEVFKDIAQSDQKVVVLRAAGKAFCAGHNIRHMQAMRQSEDGGTAGFADLFDRCAAMMLQIRDLPQPVIAQVHGLATAAGCQLVAACDMAVAAEDARFGVNGVNIGLFCSTPMVALSRTVPRKKAFEMLTTGEFILAQQAEALGLVNRVVHTGVLAEETAELAETVASKLNAAVRIGKQAFYEQLEMTLDVAYTYTRAAMVTNLANPDTQEGMQAFIEKRKPNWS